MRGIVVASGIMSLRSAPEWLGNSVEIAADDTMVAEVPVSVREALALSVIPMIGMVLFMAWLVMLLSTWLVTLLSTWLVMLLPA